VGVQIAYTVSGLAVGFIVGLTGVGGGSLMTPLLVLVFGINPATAVGTDLLYASITKSAGAVVHSRKGHVDWKLVGALASGSVPSALVTVGILHLIGVEGRLSSGLITGSLGVAVILTAIALLFKERLVKLARTGEGARRWRERHAYRATALTGAIIGVLVTLSSVGAGALGVTALFWLFPAMATVRIVGSDIAHAVPLTAVAGLGHFAMGTVDLSLLGALLLGSLPGIYIGSHLSSRVPEQWLRPALASLLILVGGKLVL
jgi:uncharacterized protein